MAGLRPCNGNYNLDMFEVLFRWEEFVELDVSCTGLYLGPLFKLHFMLCELLSRIIIMSFPPFYLAASLLPSSRM